MRYRELAIAPNVSTTAQRVLKAPVCIYSTLCGSTSMVISKSKKTESIRRINDSRRQGANHYRNRNCSSVVTNATDQDSASSHFGT